MELLSTSHEGATTPRASRLLMLPSELRLIIYEHLFEPEHSDTIVDVFATSPPQKALLQVCRQIHRESRTLYQQAFRKYWRQTRFEITTPKQTSMSSRVRDVDLAHITSIRVTISSRSVIESHVEYCMAYGVLLEVWCENDGVHPNTPLTFQRDESGRWRVIAHSNSKKSKRGLEIRDIEVVFFDVAMAPLLSGKCLTVQEAKIIQGMAYNPASQSQEYDHAWGAHQR